MKLTLESHNEEGVKKIVEFSEAIKNHPLVNSGKMTLMLTLSEDPKALKVSSDLGLHQPKTVKVDKK